MYNPHSKFVIFYKVHKYFTQNLVNEKEITHNEVL
jgi:hypothetical protein